MNGSVQEGETPPEPPDGGGPSEEDSFTPNGEEKTFDFSNTVVKIEKDGKETDGTLDDIKVGSLLSLESPGDTIKTAIVLESDQTGSETQIDQGDAARTIDTDSTIDGETFESSSDDQNALRISNAKVKLNNIIVRKTVGNCSSTENGDFYGMNAALLVTNKAQADIVDSQIESSAKNGNGVFCYGEGTTVNIADSSITTSGDNSGGIQTTGGGKTNASNLNIETSGNSSAAIRSDRGGGTVTVDGGKYVTNGYNSPSVYSTADISAKNAELRANNSESLVVEGKNSIALENCTVSRNMSDSKGASSDINVHNVMIYQSMSGDADTGRSSLSMKGGSITGSSGDMFYITNTDCTVDLENTAIENEDKSGRLFAVTGNNAKNGWGKAGENGASAQITTKQQKLEGRIEVDTISELDLTLSENSSFTGSIKTVDNAEGGKKEGAGADVKIEEGSVWTLTENTTINTLENKGTINYNGYTITLADGTVLK